MIKEIKYNGLSANPSDYINADGDLAFSLGVVPEDGTVKPVLKPTTILNLNPSEKVFIHETSAFKHYIIYDGTTGKIQYIDSEDTTKTRIDIGAISYVSHFNTVGNTLITFSEPKNQSVLDYTNHGLSYFLWKDDKYLSLGNHIPDVQVSFGLVGYPRLYSVSDESAEEDDDGYKGFEIEFNEIAEDDIFNDFDDDNQTKITEQVMAKVNKFIADQTVNKGRFCFPFFVRYALRLYDGSLVCHSAPILMNPSTKHGPVVLWNRITGKGKYTKAMLDIMLVAAELDYHVLQHNIPGLGDSYDGLENWSDIIKSIEVFVSKPMYTHNQEGKVTSFDDSDDFNSVFIGRLNDDKYADEYKGDYSITSAYGSPKEDLVTGSFSTENGLHKLFLQNRYYAEWDYGRIYAMYFGNSSRTFPSATLHLPEFSQDKTNETLQNVSNFYKLCSIDIKDAIKTTSKSTTRNVVLRNRITIEDDYLQSLLAREVMTDDYLSHDRMFADYSFAFNSRLNLAGLKRLPYKGFFAQSMFAYCDKLIGWSVDDAGYISIKGDSQVGVTDNYAIDVYIKENGETYAVRNYLPTDYPLAIYNSALSTTGNVTSKPSWGCYLFYPNANAYKMVIWSQSKATAVDLKEHEFLNGAFALLDYNVIRDSVEYSPETTVKSTPIPIPNKIYTSEVNNPFYFPLLGINTIGTGEIRGICTAAKALSQGQFGQFPLYAFSTDGVWALEVSSSGAYVAKQPITRDVCTNSESITQIDSAVLFATDRGIMHISGSQCECISDIINSNEIFDINNLPQVKALLGLFNKLADTELTEKEIVLIPFTEFLKNCRMIYDYKNQHIIVANPDIKYAYIFSLKSKTWGMILSDIADSVNSYPDALAVSTDGRLIDFSNPLSDEVPAMIVTRPFKMQQPDIFKTITAIIQRGYFKKNAVNQILYSSNNLYDWHLVWSSNNKYMRGFSGSPYKFFRLAVILKLDKSENIFGCSIDYRTRITNKLR